MRRAFASKGLWCLLVCFGLTTQALADNTADEADIAFSVGNQAYAKHDYEHALAGYFLSYRLVPNRNVLFNIARCFEAQSRFDEAYRYWHDLSVDPGLPEAERPQVKQALARLGPRVALVTITTNPPGADLYVDRKDLGSRGQTPATIAVTPGSHTFHFELAGHEPASATASALKGREVKTEATLKRILGKVELSGTPTGASIRETVDGPVLGTLPATLDLVPGQKLLVIQAPDYLPQQVLLNVKANERISSAVALTEKPKPTGKVVVTSNRDSALVKVDSRESGFTPTVLSLPVGEYELEVSSPDVTPLQQHIVVSADSEQKIVADLRYAPPKVRAASKTALTVDQAPASVTVITREELQAFGYQTVTEALRAVRGIFLTDDRLYTYIGIRGFQPPGDLNTRLLVLWDGHPTNDVWAGQGYAGHDFEVDLSEVDRIEVVRGPASLLFGTGAFFGVINIVPRDRIANRNVEGVVGAGGLNGGKVRLTGSLGSEGKSVLASAAGFNAEGAPFTDLGTRGQVQGLDGERAIGASMRASYGGFTLVGKVNQRRKQIPTAPLGSQLGVPGTEYTDARGFGELRFEHAFERVTLNVRASYDGTRYRGYYASLDADGARLRDTDTGGGDWFGAEIRAGINLFGKNQLTVAAEGSAQFLYQQPVGFTMPDPHNRYVFSGTLLDEWQLHPRVFVQAGVRLDKYLDVPDLALSPRGALVLRLYDSGITKLVAGQAFRAPNIYELYYNDDFATLRPARTLKPELITTFELEHSHNFTPELRLTVGGYFNLIDRLVGTTTDTVMPLECGGGTVACFIQSNQPDRVYAGGAEAELRWQPGRFTMVNATYSFVVLKGPTAGDYSYPQHLASLRALIPLKEGLVRLSAQGVYQSARIDSEGRASGEALLINLGFSGEYGFFRYFAGVQNLLDSRYALPVQSEVGNGRIPQYGRTFYLEASAGF